MKKVILLSLVMLLLSNVANAGDCNYTCVAPYNKSSKVSSFFSNITGLNFARTKISEAVMKKAISKSIQGGKLKVDIDSFSGKDLANGIFKSLTISGSDISVDGVYLSSAELKSLCEFNYIEYDKQGNLSFKEDFPMSFNLQMSSDDLNKTMQSERYKKAVSGLNKLSFAGIKAPQASIRGNKFYYTLLISIPFMKEQKIELSADLTVNNGKIDFENTRLSSNSRSFDLKKLNYIVNYINPLDFSVNIFDNKNAKINVKNVSIKNNIIIAEGVVIIPKD